MRKIIVMLALVAFVGLQGVFAQTSVTGTVSSSEDGGTLPGVSVVVEGTSLGTTTDMDGRFSLSVPTDATALLFSFVGMEAQRVAFTGQTVINVVLKSSALQLDEFVVTALGVSREKKSLGYAAQEIGGDAINEAKNNNLINSLSGRVSGVEVKSSGNMGGSTNIIIRGSKSLTGNNQALFVVDGVPITNSTFNTGYQKRGGAGFDFGSGVSDINPNDIKSISILKGAAATALYGSRAANGVILITTKTGSDNKGLGAKGIGVSFSSNVTAGVVDKSTFPTYQTGYGGGYGPYYSGGDHPGLSEGPLPWTNGADVLYFPSTEDASYGEAFDPNLLVYQWDAFVPESPNYQTATPWVNAANGPITFFETAVTTSNTLAVDGSSENTEFRLSYTNFVQTGILPNSKLDKNSFALSGSHKVLDNVTVSSSANFVHQSTVGRNNTGYSDNVMSSFRQWWQMNTDVQDQKDIYDLTGKNYTWNPAGPEYGNNNPIYWNNIYWERYNNVPEDTRDHLFGNIQAKWDINDYLSLTARASLDYYSQFIEEFKGYGSVSGAFGIGLGDVTSGYARTNINFMETNYDVMLNFKKELTDKLSLSALVGGNIRRNSRNFLYASTNGGLIVPDLYSIANSASPPLAALESAQKIGVNGIFGSVSLGYNSLFYLDATLRRDQSSTLPEDDNSYLYPSISGSFIFSNLVDSDWMQFGKVRLNYAEVGNDAPFASLFDTYSQPSPFGNASLFSVPSTKNNDVLKSEKTKSMEAGLEMTFLNKRLGFDLAAYKTNTINQIMPVAVSSATGYTTKYVNAGEVQNQGIELNIFGTPVLTNDFTWNVNVNWAANRNEVVSLFEDVKNLQLGSFQGGLTLNARVGEPYGTIQGKDFIYLDGQKVVGDNGFYLRTTTVDNVLGNVNPDWHAGVTNSFSYKSWTASFLIDIQKGGSVFSLDQYYGQGTGLYANTAGLNDLGNPVRDAVADGGGVILEGVTEDGQVNTTRVYADRYSGPYGWKKNPNAEFVYDASYVKLREAQISYNIPNRVLQNTGISSLSVGLVGTNLWILFKNLPDADPEAGLGAGNAQGWQSGVMPTTRNIGFNLKVQF